MQITRPKRDTVGICYVGLGNRGMRVLTEHLMRMTDVRIISVCDLDQGRLEKCRESFASAELPLPLFTTDYSSAIKAEGVDAVVVMTAWDTHSAIALESLRAGKYTAIEVGCAYELSECFELVRAYEEQGAPLMMLENCCYGGRELTALRMAREGIFGEILHAEGAYRHNLIERELVKDGVPQGYRAEEYRYRNCDNYPTHALGPISKMLNINRGNRILTLSSFASASRSIGCGCGEGGTRVGFKQGDILTTVLRCAGGQTVTLTLDTTLPRPYYSRGLSVRGTAGALVEEGGGASFYLSGMAEPCALNEEDMLRQYAHPLYFENMESFEEGWHRENIDWLVLRAFIEAVKAGTDTPIDAYDTATWMAVGTLSEKSVALGGAPVEFPDLTRGAWMRREAPPVSKYSLDYIIKDDKNKIYQYKGDGYDKKRKA